MNDLDRYAKKTDLGSHKRTCQNPDCPHGFEFTTANPRAKYCCDKCQRSAQNARHYARRKAMKQMPPLGAPTHGWRWAHLLDDAETKDRVD